MATIIVKKRRVLSLKKNSEQVEANSRTKGDNQENAVELTGQQRNEEHNRRQTEESQRQYLACRDWLYSAWPYLFDQDNVKPFSIGIIKQMKAAYDEQGGFESLGFYRTTPFKKVMARWVRRKAYQKALIADGAYRYGLDGQRIEPISEKDKLSALERLDIMKKRNRKKK